MFRLGLLESSRFWESSLRLADREGKRATSLGKMRSPEREAVCASKITRTYRQLEQCSRGKRPMTHYAWERSLRTPSRCRAIVFLRLSAIRPRDNTTANGTFIKSEDAAVLRYFQKSRQGSDGDNSINSTVSHKLACLAEVAAELPVAPLCISGAPL